MADTVSAVLIPWASFYVMAGSSAAALTGLMFVVITLVTDADRIRRNPDGLSAFSTPTVVHFCMALLSSAILVAPWRLLVHPAALLGVAGISGVAYVLRIMHLTRNLSNYTPDVEDWAWYTGVPFVAYGAILAGAIMLPGRAVEALFALAGGVLLLIFLGIRNAWDVVTYIAVKSGNEPPSAS